MSETILDVIEKRLIPDEQAKRARGEVFTPLTLVREILYGLRKSDLEKGIYTPWGVDAQGNCKEDDPADRIGGIPLDLWRNPDTKWLDPANGIGNFPFVAFHMLDFQLKHNGPASAKSWSDEERRKHILGNMLYMIELDTGNVNTSVKIFRQILPGFTANVLCADTMSLTKATLESHFGVSTFDVIMGNPPFQDDPDRPNVKDAARTDAPKKAPPRKGGKNKLYERFTVKMLDWLTPNGFLAFVTPDNMFSGTGLDSYVKLLERRVVLLNVADVQTRHFKNVIGQSVCYFLVQNAEPGTNALILSTSGSFETPLQLRSVNPVRNWTQKTEELIDKYICSQKNGFEYNRGTSAGEYTGGTYEVVYTPTQILSTNDVSLAPMHGVPFKVILFEAKPRATAVYDETGKYGVGPHTFYYVAESDEQAKKLVEFTKSAEYNTLLDLILTSQFLKSSFIQYLNIPLILGLPSDECKKPPTPRKKPSARQTRRNKSPK